MLSRNYGLTVDRPAPQHFWSQWNLGGGKEKAPAAMCSKAAEAQEEAIEVWGGLQSRSFHTSMSA